jgi:hypothetical protein
MHDELSTLMMLACSSSIWLTSWLAATVTSSYLEFLEENYV